MVSFLGSVMTAFPFIGGTTAGVGALTIKLPSAPGLVLGATGLLIGFAGAIILLLFVLFLFAATG